MSGHTPGPWEIHDKGRIGEWGDNSPSVCAVHSDGTCQPLFIAGGPGNLDECKANLCLIAAAPDLLAALRALCADTDLVFAADQGPTGEGWRSDERVALWAAAEAAIAKAEGK